MPKRHTARYSVVSYVLNTLSLKRMVAARGCTSQRLRLLAARLAAACLICLSTAAQAPAQNIQFTQGGTGTGPDNSLQIPIAAYPGRGASLSVTLFYSSRLWRLGHVATVNDTSYYTSITEAIYAEYSTAGWKTSLDLPIIEWPKEEDQYYYTGKQFCFICGSNFRRFRVARVYIHMPDGATHELRQNDIPYEGALRVTGTFYAVDGSRLRYDSTSRTTGTLYMPDGSRYVLNGATAQYRDRDGNTLNYNADEGKWTDTLNREITLPFPTNPQAQTYNYAPSGFSQDFPYKFIFKHLADPGVLTPLPGNTDPPARKPIANNYLPNPNAAPTNYNGNNYPQWVQSSWGQERPSLFITDQADEEAPFTYVLGRGQTSGELFNPIVLAEVVLPNGLSYKFGYNIYGEIDKIIYPGGAYERFEYAELAPTGDLKPPYSQANRAVKLRQQSPKGDGSDFATWRYEVTPASVVTFAPDGSYGVTRMYDFEAPLQSGTHSSPRFWPFGFVDARDGLVYEEIAYDKPPPPLDTGVMLRRTLTDFEWTTVPVPPRIGLQGEQTVYATRNARPTKQVSLILDTGGDALARKVTYQYRASDPDPYMALQLERTVGLDRTGVTETNFTALAQAAATTSTITALANDYTYPPSSSSETVYLNDPSYRERHILNLATSVTVKDAAEQPVSRAETFYDETAYPLITYNDLSGDQNYIDPGTAQRGNPTTVRRYTDLAQNRYLETHAQFDQYGNAVNFWDERVTGTLTEANATTKKEYSVNYRHAYLTQTTIVAPDPSNDHGSNTPFITRTTYETATGHVLTAQDANDRITTFSYKINETTRDPLNRLRQVTRPDNSWTKLTYNDVAGNLYVHTETQLDAGRNTHAYQFFDKLLRANHSLMAEGGGSYIAADTEYDKMGRVIRTSNPYRTQTFGGTVEGTLWTTNEYDPLGRVSKVTLPDGTFVTTEYRGVYTTVTDQADKRRRQKVDAQGRIVRVDEPVTGGGLGDYDAPAQPSFYEYDTFGNIVRISQGLSQPGANPEAAASYVQHRYFKYDALSRLTHEKQVEQAGTINAADPLTGNSSWSRRLTYDETRDNVSYAGLLTTAEDARHVYSFFYYDRIGRTYLVDYSDETPTVRRRYDQARTDAPPAGEQAITFYNRGRLTELTTDPAGAVPQTQHLYDYDLLGRTRRQQQSVGTNAYDLRYAHNLAGSLVSERYPSGRVVNYGYDDAGRLLSAGSGTTAYASAMTYKPFGGLESMTLGNGSVYSMAYSDTRLQLAGITLSQGGNTLQKYEYKYGRVNMATGAVDESKNNGQLASIESTVGTQKLWQQRFTHDDLGRLSAAGEYSGVNFGTQSYLLNYDYDVYGNRYQQSSRNQNNPVTQKWVEFGSEGYDSMTNRFASSNMTYDDAGNVTRDARFRMLKFQYDANNRQKQSSNLDDSNAVVSVYDGAGRRVATMAAGAITRVMVYDASGTLAAEYGGSVSTNGTQYVMPDQQGSIRLTMFGAPVNGQLVAARQDYLPFGEDVPGGIGARAGVVGYGQATGPRKKYAGMEEDSTTRMGHTLWREYENESGRWTAPDPYGGSLSPTSPQSFNRYTYVNNDPVNKVDPDGLMGVFWGASWGWNRMGWYFGDYRNFTRNFSRNITAAYVGGDRKHNIPMWDKLSSEQRRLFTSYFEMNLARQIGDDSFQLSPAAYWNISAMAANSGSGMRTFAGYTLLTSDQLATFIGVTNMWEYAEVTKDKKSIKGGWSRYVRAVTEIEKDNGKDKGFRLRGIFVEGGGEAIAAMWHKVMGDSKTGADGTVFSESYRERGGALDSPNGQFTMTKDLKRFDSDVDYHGFILPWHGTHNNSNTEKQWDDNLNRYKP